MKRGHEFGREQENVYRIVWRKERKWENDVIIMSKIKKIPFHYRKCKLK